MSLHRPIEVKAVEPYKLYVKFIDGVEGEVDLSSLKDGVVFEPLEEYKVFEKVYVDESGAIAWNDEMDICADAVYFELKKKQDAKD